MDIINTLANERRVERMVENIARQPLSANLKDLSQMVYVILLEYDADKLIDLWQNNQINYFISRIIMNQYHSVKSPYYALFRRFQRKVDEDITLSMDGDNEHLDILDSIRVL